MRTAARIFTGPVMLVAGINHFVMPATYASIVPDYLPAPYGLVYVSGIAEILGALGSMHPRTRRAGGWLLIATLVAIFPANIHMALNPDEYPTVPGGQAGLIARLPLQAMFLYWVWLATLAEEQRPSVAAVPRAGEA